MAGVGKHELRVLQNLSFTEAQDVAAACIAAAKVISRAHPGDPSAKILGTYGLELAQLTRASAEPLGRLRAVP